MLAAVARAGLRSRGGCAAGGRRLRLRATMAAASPVRTARTLHWVRSAVFCGSCSAPSPALMTFASLSGTAGALSVRLAHQTAGSRPRAVIFLHMNTPARICAAAGASSRTSFIIILLFMIL